MNTVSCLLAVHLLLGNMFAKGFLDSWKQRWRRSCQKIKFRFPPNEWFRLKIYCGEKRHNLSSTYIIRIQGRRDLLYMCCCHPGGLWAYPLLALSLSTWHPAWRHCASYSATASLLSTWAPTPHTCTRAPVIWLYQPSLTMPTLCGQSSLAFK
jgi:hypothetical protein